MPMHSSPPPSQCPSDRRNRRAPQPLFRQTGRRAGTGLPLTGQPLPFALFDLPDRRMNRPGLEVGPTSQPDPSHIPAFYTPSPVCFLVWALEKNFPPPTFICVAQPLPSPSPHAFPSHPLPHPPLPHCCCVGWGGEACVFITCPSLLVPCGRSQWPLIAIPSLTLPTPGGARWRNRW